MVVLIRRLRRWERIALLEYALSARTRPGRVRGRPGPRRAILSRPMSGMKATESWRCPALVTRASGRQPESASRWTLVVSPPRDRPSASRSFGLPGFVPAGGGSLSFGSAPCADRGAQHGHRQPPRVDVRRRGVPRPGRVLVRPDDRRIRRHRPRPPLRLIAPGPQRIQDHLPRPVPGPAAMPVVHRLPVPEPLRQVPPRAPRPGPVEDPVDHHPVVIPPVPLPRMSGQQRRQQRPLRTGQIMPVQPIIIHHRIQAGKDLKIYGTRPRRTAYVGCKCCCHSHHASVGLARI